MYMSKVTVLLPDKQKLVIKNATIFPDPQFLIIKDPDAKYKFPWSNVVGVIEFKGE